MAYLAKSTVLHAYKLLSEIDSEKQQGLTQKVSALKYASALDLYYSIHGQNCDLKQSTNRDEFASYVGEIVKINDKCCTKDFYLSISTNGRDFDCGSNFYSQSSVKDSKTNPNNIFLYPKRSGWKPVMDIKDQVLIYRGDYFSDCFSFYLGTSELRLAFIVWLLRFKKIEKENINGLRNSLYKFFSQDFCNALYDDSINFVDTSYVEFDDEMCQLSEEDFSYSQLFALNTVLNSKENGMEETPKLFSTLHSKKKFLPYLTALRTKPFMLLAGISGTGKSRIVRELAKACWKEGDEEYGKNNPKNFCMVQVKPNWHDSSELIGYVSRINGEKYVVGPFLRFLAKAINDPDTPYFLCLDEMNLAPVEQYFAEYLSVIESRKSNADGSITTDPIVPYENTEAYGTLIDQLFYDDADRKEYKSETGTKRLTIPQNLFVIGTVNMDETTFSFSRKVLDRAMTIEMNEVDLHGGLTDEGSEIGYIGNSIIGDAAEGKDVYADNKDLCDQVLTYLEKVNTVLEGTPFKIAYRTRNEFLLYAVNRQLLDKDSQLWQTLDEMTSMKILSRIEGDSERTKKVLEELKVLVEEEINKSIPEPEEGKEKLKSISAAKIKEMLEKLSSGYTSYWA